MAALAVGLAAGFVALGRWQLDKALAREAAQARFDAGSRQVPIRLTPARPAAPETLHLHPVVARGHYDAAGQILIDNRVLHERAGFHVLTPLVIEGGTVRLLVNRGWIAAPATRGETPAVPVPAGRVEVAGTAIVPARRIFALAPDTAPAGGNAVWQNLDLDRYRAAAPHPVQPLVVLLSQQAADPADAGLVRDWPRPDERHARHRAYAYQWFGFAATTIAIWAWLGLRRRPPGEAAVHSGENTCTMPSR